MLGSVNGIPSRCQVCLPCKLLLLQFGDWGQHRIVFFARNLLLGSFRFDLLEIAYDLRVDDSMRQAEVGLILDVETAEPIIPKASTL